jgi:hypothetical protein
MFIPPCVDHSLLVNSLLPDSLRLLSSHIHSILSAYFSVTFSSDCDPPRGPGHAFHALSTSLRLLHIASDERLKHGQA